MTDPKHELLRRLRVLRDRPTRIVDVLREPRPIVAGGALVNRLGLQVARTLADAALWSARPARVTARVADAYEAMARDGVVVLRDFLPRDEFERVRAELRAVDPERHRVRVHTFGENFEARETLLTDFPADFPATTRALRESPFLLELASAVSRRAMTFRPHMSIFEVRKPRPDAPHTDFDYNQLVHADRHYPFVKAFFYVDDVGPEDAPYCYARGSHKLSASRLRHEYASSLAHVEARNGARTTPLAQFERDRGLSELAARHLERTGAAAEPIVAPANTMIVSNNMGFHRRGEMLGARPRITINIDYKYLESPARFIYPLVRRLVP